MSESPPQDVQPEELRKRFATLARVAVFFAVTDGDLRALARAVRPMQVAAGSRILTQGDRGDAMFVIESGRCEVSTVDVPGHSVVISMLGPGDFFGEMALISEEPRSASVRALEDTSLLCLDRTTLYTSLPEDSEALLDLNRLVDQRRASLPELVSRSRLISPEKAAVTIACYSPKGGAGKTTIAVNLACALARRHPGEVALVDLALPFNHAALISSLVPTGCLALASQLPDPAFEEALLSAILQHPGGMMLLPGVLRPEQADLINPEVVFRAMTVLKGAFTHVIFDLGGTMNDTTLSVLEQARRIVLVATPELSTLKDIKDVLGILTGVLSVAPERLITVLNNRVPKPVMSREDVERTLGRDVNCEILFDGSRPDEAAVKGEVLVLTDPKSAVTRGVSQLASILEGERRGGSPGRKLPFGLGG